MDMWWHSFLSVGGSIYPVTGTVLQILPLLRLLTSHPLPVQVNGESNVILDILGDIFLGIWKEGERKGKKCRNCCLEGT